MIDDTFWEVAFITATYTAFFLFVLELLGVALYLFLARKGRMRVKKSRSVRARKQQYDGLAQKVMEDINSITALAEL